IAIWTEVGRVHRIRVVVVRIRMLNLDDDQARKIGSSPFLIKLVGILLLNLVVTFEMKTLAIFRLEIWIRRGFAEAVEVGRKVTVENHEGIMSVGMTIKTF